MYLLLLFTLTTVFKKVAAAEVAHEQASSFRGLPVTIKRSSTFRLDMPDISTPSLRGVRVARNEDVPPMPEPLPQSITGHDAADEPQQLSQGRPPSQSHSALWLSRPVMPTRTSISSWLNSRRMSRSRAPYEADDERLWTQDEAEKGLASATGTDERKTPSNPRLSQYDDSEFGAKESAKWMDPMFLSVLTESPQQAEEDDILGAVPNFQPPRIPKTPGQHSRGPSQTSVGIDIASPSTVHSFDAATALPSGSVPSFARPPRADAGDRSPTQRHTFLSLTPTTASPSPNSSFPSFMTNVQDELDRAEGSSRGLEVTDSVLFDPRAVFRRSTTDSPIYGLNGLRASSPGIGYGLPGQRFRESLARNSGTSFASASDSAGIDELLRQQQALDASIAKLRLFNATPSPTETPERPAFPEAARQSSDTTTKLSSGEFSLRNFPMPPFGRGAPGSPARSEVPTPETGSPRVRWLDVDDLASKGLQRVSSADSGLGYLAPPRMPAVMTEGGRRVSVPKSTRGSVDSFTDDTGRSPKFDSQGTQYEITSFIGGECREGFGSSNFPIDDPSLQA